MALKLIANYSKRLGLPGYSSHQYSVCVETEINNINDVAGESSRLYQSLQQSVDEEIQHTGFVPDHGYGMEGKTNGNGSPNRTNGNGNGKGHTNADGWVCSDKQRDLILKLVDEHHRLRILYQEATGKQESGLELHHLVKTKVPKLVVSEAPATTEGQRTKFFRLIESFVDGVDREDYVPSPGLQCAACEYFNECRRA